MEKQNKEEQERKLNNFNVVYLSIVLFISMMTSIFGAVYKRWFICFCGIILLLVSIIHYFWSKKRFGDVYFKFKQKGGGYPLVLNKNDLKKFNLIKKKMEMLDKLK